MLVVNYRDPIMRIDVNLQLLQVVFILMEKKRGIQSSGVIFMFWLFMVICGIPEYRTYFINILGEVSVSTLFMVVQDFQAWEWI